MALSPAFLKRRGIRPEPVRIEYEFTAAFTALAFEDRHQEITFFVNGAWNCPAPTGYESGRSVEIFIMNEDAVAYALTWPGSFVWLEGPLTTLNANKRVIVSIKCALGFYLASYVAEP